MQTAYVISDLHLGGEPGYAICTPRTQALLADFLKTLTCEVKSGSDVHLVVNGDSVDFLAEREFQAFTGKDVDAEAKLASIIRSTQAIWDGFAAFVKGGGELTFTIGNHDIELALPGPRALLEKQLGPGRVNLLLRGESLHIGNVLIKHGNQYDRWNRVDHGSLSRYCQSVVEGAEPENFEPPAGSRLVHEIMNPIKEQFSFINLLKPENQGAVPFLGILSPRKLAYIDEFLPLFVDAQATEVDTSAVAGTRVSHRHPDDDEELQFAKEIAFEGQDTEEVGNIRDWFEEWKEARDARQRRKQLIRLRRVLDRWLDKHLLAFNTLVESAEYLEPATRAASEHGFAVILYGHTHLAKRIPIHGTDAVYLNTGTWAELMCVPDSVLLPELDDSGERQLSEFAEDLKHNRLDRWTSRLPTYARIEMDEGRARDVRLLIWEGEGKSKDVPDGRISRLLVGAEHAVRAGEN